MNWTQFFRAAGIPDAALQPYCVSFAKNRIQQSDLPDLDKDTLGQLGVKAIGDQLAILRHIKKGATGSTAATSSKHPRITVETPDSSSFSGDRDMSMASFHRKGRPPPDSNEIYHVKMPLGTTARTRQILLKAQQRGREVIRGTTGVRQGGRPVSPIDKNSVAVKNMRREENQIRVINKHLGGRNRVNYGNQTVTVTVPERQQRQRISFGDEPESRLSRVVVQRPIAKVISGSRIMKRMERPTITRQTVQNRITYGTGRNNRVVVRERIVNEDDVVYDDGDYMGEDDGYVEYVDEGRNNVFSRVTM